MWPFTKPSEEAGRAKINNKPYYLRNMKLLEKSLLASLGVSVCIMSGGCHGKNDRASATNIPEIEVAEPIIRNVVVTQSYPASIVAADQADVVGRVNGLIMAKHFKEGDRVRRGQLLFTIESSVYDAALREAEANLASAQAQLRYASHHYAALNKAYQSHAVSEIEVAQALSHKESAEAGVLQARSRVATSRTQAGYCRITAPVDGIISVPTLDVGNYVNGEGSPTVLATIYNNDRFELEFAMPERGYSAIVSDGHGFRNEIYRKVKVLLTDDEAQSGAPYSFADITYQSPSVDSSTGNIKMRGIIEDSPEMLQPGMYALVLLPVSEVKDGLLVDDASISTDQRGKYLYTVNSHGQIAYTPISVGELYEDTLRLVKAGLKPGERYVTQAMLNVRAGEKVKPRLRKSGSQ